MPTPEEAQARLAGIPNLTVSRDTPLSRYTRFGIGGPADLYAETKSVEAFIAATAAARESGLPTMVIGGGTNLIVSDTGFRGIVLRYRAD
jgi:UDP-N-acetylmuramate dehydrogenase